MASVQHPALSVVMCYLSWPGGADCRDNFPRQPLAADLVVPDRVVGDEPEERNQRHGFGVGTGLEDLQEGVDDNAGVVPRHGASGWDWLIWRIEAGEALVGGEEEGYTDVRRKQGP